MLRSHDHGWLILCKKPSLINKMNTVPINHAHSFDSDAAVCTSVPSQKQDSTSDENYAYLCVFDLEQVLQDCTPHFLHH